MFFRELNIRTSSHQEIVDITRSVRQVVEESRISSGLCNVFIPHATAALIINENADPSLRRDILKSVAGLVPEGVWQHDLVDDNAAAHIKSSLFGPSITIPITDSGLALGSWQGIGLAEFDGPRKRKIIISIISDTSNR